LKQSFPGCDAKSSSLGIPAFWLPTVSIVELNPIFEIFLKFLFKADPAFMSFFVSVAHAPSIFGCSGESALPNEHKKFRTNAARRKPYLSSRGDILRAREELE
jgi:hypothetical protein